MQTAAILASLKNIQSAFIPLVLLELTGHLFLPPVVLKPGDVFDYIIVGGGTAGSVIATRLAQKNYNVLLIEAGQDKTYETVAPGLVAYLKNSHVDWNYTSENDNYSYQCHTNKNVELALGKMLGGTGAMSFMVYSKGNPENYEEWYHITKDPTWKWQNVLRYFLKLETIHDSAIENSSHKHRFGKKGYIGITKDKSPLIDKLLKGFEQIGKDLIDDIDGYRVGYSRALLTIYNKMRQDPSRYVSQVVDNPYLAIAKGTLATKIIFDENKNAVAVEVITDEGKKIKIHARQEIILAAGAIKTPQLLMLSGVGPRTDLEKNNIPCISDIPAVGKNLQDHVAVFIPHKTNKVLDNDEKDPGEYPTPIYVGYASLNESHSKCGCHTKFPDYEAIGLIFNEMKVLLEYCASTFNFPTKTCDKLFQEANGNQVLITLLTNLYVKSRGQVLLRSSNPEDPPKVITGSFSYDPDLDDLVSSMTDYLKVEESKAFKSLGATMIDLTKCNAFKKGTREYWRCFALCMMVSLGNYGGTCAMGSVVDSRLRVHGVNKLRVADASIMPTIVAGNIFAPVVMIGEKAADFIINDAGKYKEVAHDIVKLEQLRNRPPNLG